MPEFPAAVLPVLGLENHSAADVRQPAYQVRQGRHFPYPVPDLFHCSCRRDGHGKHSGRGGGSLSGRCRCNFLDVGIRPAGHGSDLQRKCTGSAVCPHTPRRHQGRRPHGVSPVRAAQSRSGSILQSLLHRCFAGHGQHDTEQCHFHPCRGGVLPAATVDRNRCHASAGNYFAPRHTLHRQGHSVAHAGAVGGVSAGGTGSDLPERRRTAAKHSGCMP